MRRGETPATSTEAAVSRVAGDFESDLDEFFTDFRETATYTKYGSAATTIDVIFDDQGNVINPATLEVESSGPKVTCKTSDVDGASNKDTLVIQTITYYVIRVEHDGTGMSVLYLSKRTAHGG